MRQNWFFVINFKRTPVSRSISDLSKIEFFHIYIFFYLGFLSRTFTNRRTAGEKGEAMSLTTHYHFHSIHTYLDISQAIAAESSPLQIACSWYILMSKGYFVEHFFGRAKLPGFDVITLCMETSIIITLSHQMFSSRWAQKHYSKRS